MPKEYRSGQLGNMAPLHGEFEIKQDSSSLPALTIMGATGGATSAESILEIQRASLSEFSSVGGTPVFRVEHDGVWGMRKVIALSSASTGITLAASQSGAFLLVPDNTAGAQTITLPAMAAGIWYEIYQAGGVAGSGITITAATAGTLVVKGDAEANSIQIGGATAVALGGSLRLITDGTKWYTVMQPAVTSAAMATNTYTLFGIET